MGAIGWLGIQRWLICLQDGEEQISSDEHREGAGAYGRGGEDEAEDLADACFVCQGPDYKVLLLKKVLFAINDGLPLSDLQMLFRIQNCAANSTPGIVQGSTGK